MNGQFVLHALRRWWKAAFLIGLLLATIATAAVYWLFEPQYEAASLLEISERPQYIAFEPREAGASQAYFRTQIELIRSRWILGRALDNEKIRQFPEIRKESNPIQWLKKRVSVVSANESGVFEIKYASSNPENAALVVNEITKQYLAAQEEEESQRNHVIVAALTEEMKSRGKGRRDAPRPSPGCDEADLRKGTGSRAAQPEFPAKNPLGELQARLVAVQVERRCSTRASRRVKRNCARRSGRTPPRTATGRRRRRRRSPSKNSNCETPW